MPPLLSPRTSLSPSGGRKRVGSFGSVFLFFCRWYSLLPTKQSLKA